MTPQIPINGMLLRRVYFPVPRLLPNTQSADSLFVSRLVARHFTTTVGKNLIFQNYEYFAMINIESSTEIKYTVNRRCNISSKTGHGCLLTTSWPQLRTGPNHIAWRLTHTLVHHNDRLRQGIHDDDDDDDDNISP